MTTTISVKPSERGTAIVEMLFTDEKSNVVTPTSLKWQFMRTSGVVINNRSFANCPFTATGGEAEVVLSGDDLAIFGSSDSGIRLFSVQGVYDSTAGTGLPLTDELIFAIQPLLGQVDAV
jgi:hypothetical protein